MFKSKQLENMNEYFCRGWDLKIISNFVEHLFNQRDPKGEMYKVYIRNV